MNRKRLLLPMLAALLLIGAAMASTFASASGPPAPAGKKSAHRALLRLDLGEVDAVIEEPAAAAFGLLFGEVDPNHFGNPLTASPTGITAMLLTALT